MMLNKKVGSVGKGINAMLSEFNYTSSQLMPVESPSARPTLSMMIGTGYLEQVVPQLVKNFVIWNSKAAPNFSI